MKKEPKEKKVGSSKKTYRIEVEMNDKVFKVETDDLAEAILALKPEVLKTKVIFRIWKGDLLCQRMAFVTKGRLIFGKQIMLDVFIKQLIFKDPAFYGG